MIWTSVYPVTQGLRVCNMLQFDRRRAYAFCLSYSHWHRSRTARSRSEQKFSLTATVEASAVPLSCACVSTVAPKGLRRSGQHVRGKVDFLTLEQQFIQTVRRGAG